MESAVRLIHGDCLEVMHTLEAGSVDAIITDLPYGTTACKWDTIIPFVPMWEAVKRVLKPKGAFVTTASQPFTSLLITSNLAWFRYEWIWEKALSGSPATCRIMPLKTHENILVFGNSVNYYPIMENGINRKKGVHGVSIEGHNFINSPKNSGEINDKYYPRSVMYFSNADRRGKVHPTQKPVALYEYLIKTYTNEGETVLDMCMGSGTTIIAALNTGRKAIGIEKDADIFATAERRINEH